MIVIVELSAEEGRMGVESVFVGAGLVGARASPVNNLVSKIK